MDYKGPVLFLTNNENTKKVQRMLRDRGEELLVSGDRVSPEFLEEVNPSILLSFNYQYLIKPSVIEMMEGRTMNIHCSLLPFNRGSNPNFFSFYTNTPKGVTIHELSNRLDEGKILLQMEVPLTDEETFKSSYDKLMDAAFSLVKDNWNDLRHLRIEPHEQIGNGSYHTYSELEEIRRKYPFEWNDRICEWKRRNGLP